MALIDALTLAQETKALQPTLSRQLAFYASRTANANVWGCFTCMALTAL